MLTSGADATDIVLGRRGDDDRRPTVTSSSSHQARRHVRPPPAAGPLCASSVWQESERFWVEPSAVRSACKLRQPIRRRRRGFRVARGGELLDRFGAVPRSVSIAFSSSLQFDAGHTRFDCSAARFKGSADRFGNSAARFNASNPRSTTKKEDHSSQRHGIGGRHEQRHWRKLHTLGHSASGAVVPLAADAASDELFAVNSTAAWATTSAAELRREQAVLSGLSSRPRRSATAAPRVRTGRGWRPRRRRRRWRARAPRGGARGAGAGWVSGEED